MLFSEKQSLLSIRKIRLKNQATPSELIFKKRLDELDIYYQFQKGFIAGDNFVIADFYLPKPYRLVIEIDGSIHNLPKVQRRDYWKDKYYQSRKFKVLRISNDEVSKIDIWKAIYSACC
jgi:very-short-patch-repair endonuclease